MPIDSKREVSPEEACGDPDFYCDLTSNSKLQLKENISTTIKYNYSCMYALIYFSGVTCVYTPKGILVERILPDSVWCDNNIPKLEEYFDKHMLPEIVYPHHKPPHILLISIIILQCQVGVVD